MFSRIVFNLGLQISFVKNPQRILTGVIRCPKKRKHSSENASHGCFEDTMSARYILLVY